MNGTMTNNVMLSSTPVCIGGKQFKWKRRKMMLPLSSETPALSLVMTMAVTNVEKQLAYGSSKMNRMILPSTPVPLA